MSCKSLTFLMVGLAAAMMLAAGCGKGGDEPADPNGPAPSPTTKPAVTPPVTPPDTPKAKTPATLPDTPKVKLPVTPPDVPKVKLPVTPPDIPKVKLPVTPPDIPKVKLPVTPPDVPKVKLPVTPPDKPEVKPPKTPPDKPKPAAGDKIETGWSNVKVGSMVKFKMQNNITMTQEVTKVTDDTVTVKVTTVIPAMPAPMVRSQDYPRYATPNPDAKAPKVDPKHKGKKLPDQTLTVGGKSLKCEVWEMVAEAAGKKTTSRSYMSKEVPGWMVKSESDATGSMVASMELVEFKE